MKLNDKERAELVKFLKKQYAENNEMIERNEFPFWCQDEKQREDFITYTNKLKEDYEAVERAKAMKLKSNTIFGEAIMAVVGY